MNIFPNAVGSSSQGADPLVGVYDANMDLNLDLRNLIDGVLRSNRVVTPFQDDEAVVEAQWFVSLRDIAQEILSADVPDDLPHDIYMSSTNSDDKVLELERSNMSRCLLNEAAGRYLRCLFGFKRCLDDRTTEDVEYVSKHFLSLLEKVGESESSKSMPPETS
ncbi:hypothetical protein ERJ75_001648300 [Trypanosoma vivax]|nr:hypothetical protein ERJ75_001648300 [Trypanosoma vivax]